MFRQIELSTFTIIGSLIIILIIGVCIGVACQNAILKRSRDVLNDRWDTYWEEAFRQSNYQKNKVRELQERELKVMEDEKRIIIMYNDFFIGHFKHLTKNKEKKIDMNTEHLDYEIWQLTQWDNDNLLHEIGKAKLAEYKAIKKKLNQDEVSNNVVTVCSCGNKLQDKEIFYETCFECGKTVS